MASSTSSSVLLKFGESTRVVRFSHLKLDEVEGALETELKKIDPDVKLVLGCKNQHKKESESEKPVFMQRYSSEWQQYVDVIDVIEIDCGDKLKAVSFNWPTNTIVSLLTTCMIVCVCGGGGGGWGGRGEGVEVGRGGVGGEWSKWF